MPLTDVNPYVIGFNPSMSVSAILTIYEKSSPSSASSTFGITVPPCSPFGGLLGIFATYSPYLNRLEVQFIGGMTTPCRLRIASESPKVFLSPCLP